MNIEFKQKYDETIKFWQTHPADPSKDGYCEKHHIILRSLGGEETVVIPVLVHLRLHLLYAQIYEHHETPEEAIIFQKAKTAITRILFGKSMQKAHIDLDSLADEDLQMIAKMREYAASAKKGQISIYNVETLERKRWPKEYPIPEGWKHGAKLRPDEIERKSKDKASRIWLSNPEQTQNRHATPEQAAKLKAQGWIEGRCVYKPGALEKQREIGLRVIASGKLTNKGRIHIYNPITHEARMIFPSDPLPDGWVIGTIPFSEQALDNIRKANSNPDKIRRCAEAQRGKPKSQESIEKVRAKLKRQIPITNGIEEKRIYPEQLAEFEALGYHRGRLMTEAMKMAYKEKIHTPETYAKVKASLKGIRWMHKGAEVKMVSAKDIQTYLDAGWKFKIKDED